jgi:hypothetical protein
MEDLASGSKGKEDEENTSRLHSTSMQLNEYLHLWLVRICICMRDTECVPVAGLYVFIPTVLKGRYKVLIQSK